MESGRRLKQGEKEGTNSKNNGGGESKSNGGRQSKGETQSMSKAGKASKCVSANNAGEPEVMGRTTEVRTGRGRAGLVPGFHESRELNQQERKRKGQRRKRRTRRQRRRIWPQRIPAEREGKRRGMGPSGA